MKRIRGFTLMEMLVLLVVIAIVAAVGLPNFTQMVRANQVTSYGNSLVGAVQLARGMAAQRGEGMAICGSSNGVACDGNWGAGWMVYADPNGNANNPAEAADIMRVGNGNDALTATTNGGIVRFTSQALRHEDSIDALLVARADCGDEGRLRITIVAGGRASAQRVDC